MPCMISCNRSQQAGQKGCPRHKGQHRRASYDLIHSVPQPGTNVPASSAFLLFILPAFVAKYLNRHQAWKMCCAAIWLLEDRLKIPSHSCRGLRGTQPWRKQSYRSDFSPELTCVTQPAPTAGSSAKSKPAFLTYPDTLVFTKQIPKQRHIRKLSCWKLHGKFETLHLQHQISKCNKSCPMGTQER